MAIRLPIGFIYIKLFFVVVYDLFSGNISKNKINLKIINKLNIKITLV
jgi:hypothetical protein